MERKTRIAALAVAAALFAIPLAAQAQVVVRVGPPALRVEPVPAPRAGFVWAPGRWHWVNGRYAWNGGRWLAARPGYRWVPGEWGHRGEGWGYVRGHWVR